MCRRQLGLNPQQYISLANERGELMGTAEALGLPTGSVLFLSLDSPPPSPPGSDLDMEEGEPPLPQAPLDSAIPQTPPNNDEAYVDDGQSGWSQSQERYAEDTRLADTDDYPQDVYQAGQEQFDQAGEWHAGVQDDGGDWQQEAQPEQPSDMGQFKCVKNTQAHTVFDPSEKGCKKTEKVKKGQIITAIETRELPGKKRTTLRIHYEGGWVSLTDDKGKANFQEHTE